MDVNAGTEESSLLASVEEQNRARTNLEKKSIQQDWTDTQDWNTNWTNIEVQMGRWAEKGKVGEWGDKKGEWEKSW